MYREVMLRRYPKAEYVGIARLEGWKFQYDGGPKDSRSGTPVGNIVISANDVVWGVIYMLQPSDKDLLDKQENVPEHYQHHIVQITTADNTKMKAFTYIRQPLPVGTPDKEYREMVVLGARGSGLPENYIEEALS